MYVCMYVLTVLCGVGGWSRPVSAAVAGSCMGEHLEHSQTARVRNQDPTR